MNRRKFLKRTPKAAVGVGAMGLVGATGIAVSAGANPLDQTFSHGVASGDPLADRVILWTRVSPNAKQHAKRTPSAVQVQWRVALDQAMRKIVAQGEVSTTAARDYTVKVDAAALQPDTYYYYQFSAQGDKSVVGRTRTAARSGAVQVKIAVASCANYPFGHFNAYRRIAEREDLNAVVHLGDYLYEYAPGTYDNPASGRKHFPEREIVSLQDYRGRHAQYKTDPDLQAAHQQHPWICVWDDHESTNNSWHGGAQNHNEGEGDWQVRKQIAIAAYHEWMPIRDQSMSIGAPHIYRSFRFGDTADLIMLDTRLHGRSEQVDKSDVDGLQDPTRTLLGADQLAWLQQQLKVSNERGSQWRLLGQQCMFGQLLGPQGGVQNADQWDGYPLERAKILDQLEAQNIDNTVILTGDIHSAWGMDITRDPFSDQYDGQTGKGSLAVELVCTSVTSPSPFGNRAQATERGRQMVATQPHIHWVDFTDRGYLVVDLDAERARAEWWMVDTITSTKHKEFLAGSLLTESGTNHLIPA